MGQGEPTRKILGLKTAESLWDEFFCAIGVLGMPEIQVREMKRAFYGGLWAMLTTMERIGDRDVPERIGHSHLEGMKADCRAFQKAMMEGRA
jgi:hypothetical protein